MKKVSLSYVSLFILILFTFCLAACSNDVNDTPTAIESGGVSAKSTESSVDLHWDMEGEKYTVSYYNDNGEKLGEKVLNSTSIKFDDLKEGENYTFLIESDKSSIFAFASTGGISQPSEIAALSFDESAMIIWEAVPGAIGYNLFIADSAEGNYSPIGFFETTSATVKNLENGITYFFKVEALFKKKNNQVFSKQNMLNTTNSEILESVGLDSYNNESANSAVLFAVPTAVTPGTTSLQVSHLFAFKIGNEVHFVWDAVPYASSYNIKNSKDGTVYSKFANTPINTFKLKLPVDKIYYKVAAVFQELIEGPESQYVKLDFITLPDWDITGGVVSVIVYHHNFALYDNVELYCVGESDATIFHRTVTKSVFLTGWLKGDRYYQCKLKVTLNGVTTESDTKRVYVLPCKESDELSSVYVYENNADLTWKSSPGEFFNIYLQTNFGTQEKIASNVEAGSGDVTRYTIKNLKCDVIYRIFVETVNNSKRVLYSKDFSLDSYYCNGTDPGPKPKPDPTEDVFKKLDPSGNIPPSYHSWGNKCTLTESTSIVHNNKIYILTLYGIYVFDPAEGTDGEWTKLSSTPALFYGAMGIFNDELYIFKGVDANNRASSKIYVLDLNSGYKRELQYNLIQNLAGNSGAFIDGNFYVPWANIMYIYNPHTNRWINKKLKNNYDKIRHSFKLNGILYHRKDDSNYLYTYNPSTNSEGSHWIDRRYVSNSAMAHYNGNVYLFGGYKNKSAYYKDDKYYNDFDVFNIKTQKTTKITPTGDMPKYRAHGELNEVNGVLYWIGGSGIDGCYNDVYAYKPKI